MFVAQRINPSRKQLGGRANQAEFRLGNAALGFNRGVEHPFNTPRHLRQLRLTHHATAAFKRMERAPDINQQITTIPLQQESLMRGTDGLNNFQRLFYKNVKQARVERFRLRFHESRSFSRRGW